MTPFHKALMNIISDQINATQRALWSLSVGLDLNDDAQMKFHSQASEFYKTLEREWDALHLKAKALSENK